MKIFGEPTVYGIPQLDRKFELGLIVGCGVIIVGCLLATVAFAAGDGDPGSRSGWNGGGGARVHDALDHGYFAGVRNSSVVSLLRDLSNWLDAHRGSWHPATERPSTAAAFGGFGYSNGQQTVTTNPGWRGY